MSSPRTSVGQKRVQVDRRVRHSPPQRSTVGDHPLLDLQRQAGNRAATLAVQRGTGKSKKSTAKTTAVTASMTPETFQGRVMGIVNPIRTEVDALREHLIKTQGNDSYAAEAARKLSVGLNSEIPRVFSRYDEDAHDAATQDRQARRTTSTKTRQRQVAQRTPAPGAPLSLSLQRQGGNQATALAVQRLFGSGKKKAKKKAAAKLSEAAMLSPEEFQSHLKSFLKQATSGVDDLRGGLIATQGRDSYLPALALEVVNALNGIGSEVDLYTEGDHDAHLEDKKEAVDRARTRKKARGKEPVKDASAKRSAKGGSSPQGSEFDPGSRNHFSLDGESPAYVGNKVNPEYARYFDHDPDEDSFEEEDDDLAEEPRSRGGNAHIAKSQYEGARHYAKYRN